MQRQLVALTVEADGLSEALVTLERESEAVAEGLDALDGLAQQMARSFEQAGVPWPPAGLALPDAAEAPRCVAALPRAPRAAAAKAAAPRRRRRQAPRPSAAPAPARSSIARYAALLADGFARATPLIERQGAVRRAKGAYFLADGRQVEGELIHVGGVAVYGVAPDAAGALTPAGNGRFKLDPVQGEATARALAAGAPLATAGIFLFESADENYEPRRSRTPLEVVEAGGAIAWVIVALGGLALLVLLARVALLAVARSPVDRLLAAIEPHVLARRYRAAAEHCERARGAGARVMAALARYLAAEHAEHERADLERVFAEGMLREEGRIDRLGSALTVIAAVAPLLGLLGTVTGMISTFDVITEFGTGNPKLLSGGISEALITTELGLVVAIPALLLGNLLNAWATALKAQVEQGALRLVNLARVGRVDAASAGTGAVEASPVPA
ncbi:MAG: MotA/TolQ/ExbB proton channel family protein [Myxococcales bacterium]|nr:MotA/TolQ/ExbB proton channel family protein [Myxococcales bacterium]